MVVVAGGNLAENLTPPEVPNELPTLGRDFVIPKVWVEILDGALESAPPAQQVPGVWRELVPLSLNRSTARAHTCIWNARATAQLSPEI